MHGLNGPVVIVSGRVAAWLLTRADLANHHRAHRGDDPEVDQTLVALKLAAYSWQAGMTGDGHRPAPTPDTGTECPLMTTQQAADKYGTTSRSIRRRIHAQQLPAVRVGHQWLIPASALDRYQPETR